MANIRDVAKRANVSTATVSRVFNNYPNVSEATRQLVWRSAREVNYPFEKLNTRPPVSHSVLVVTRDQGLVEPESGLSREFERTVWVGVQSVFEQHDITTRLQRSRMQREEVSRYVDDPAISGLILLGGVIDLGFVEELQEYGLPFVAVGSHVRPLEANCVMADVASGMRQAVAHLAEQGRTNIAFVNGPATTHTSAAKLDGLRLELQVQGLPFSTVQVVAADFFADAGYIQTQSLLAQYSSLDAIVYADDVIAIGGLKALRQAGLRVPHDVAVIGFGNYEIGRYADPSLTSVQYDMHAMGAIAARRLCMILQEPDDQHWLIMRPTALVVRESTSGNA